VCFSILKLSSENSFTVFSSFEANGSENLKRPEFNLGDGERKYQAAEEGKAKNTTHQSSESGRLQNALRTILPCKNIIPLFT